MSSVSVIGILFLAVFAQSADVHALIVGPPGPTDGLSGICEIVWYHSWGGEGGYCTGILIRPDRILTAAHCEPQGRTKVFCNGGKDIGTGKVFLGQKTSKLTARIETVEGMIEWSKNDFGILELKDSFGAVVHPIAVAGSQLQIASLVKGDCILTGFSQFSWLSRSEILAHKLQPYLPPWMILKLLPEPPPPREPPGKSLRTTKWNQDPATQIWKKYFATSGSTRGLDSTIERGDSGGAILCRDNDRQWKVVAVHSSSMALSRLPELKSNSDYSRIGFSPWVTNDLAWIQDPIKNAHALKLDLLNVDQNGKPKVLESNSGSPVLKLRDQGVRQGLK